MAKTRPDGTPLTPDDVEYRNQPHQFQEYPKWLYRAMPEGASVITSVGRMHDFTTKTEGGIISQGGIIDTAAVAEELLDQGWVLNPEVARQKAIEARNQEQRRRDHEAASRRKDELREVLNEFYVHPEEANAATSDGAHEPVEREHRKQERARVPSQGAEPTGGSRRDVPPISQQLREQMERLRLTNGDLAEMTGIGKRSVERHTGMSQ